MKSNILNDPINLKKYEKKSLLGRLAQLEHGARNTRSVGSVPIWGVHLKAGLDPCGSLLTKNILCR